MIKVITYGTYDLLHYGHIRLLKRAKELGDYLIVGVTAEDFDKTRGKINVQQSLMERVEAVKQTGLADEIIIEEYEGQKIDDIKRYNVDIFTVGSDWEGYFDYLKDYCKVVYLKRTEGISSSSIRSTKRDLRLGFVGDTEFLNKVYHESMFVNGVTVNGIFTKQPDKILSKIEGIKIINEYESLLDEVDAVYIRSQPECHYDQIKLALKKGKSVLCESPRIISLSQWDELEMIAKENNLILMDAIKTAYATAYSRLLLLLQGGRIGKIISVDASCTRLEDNKLYSKSGGWRALYEWGPTAMLPVFQILGTNYVDSSIIAYFSNKEHKYEDFVKFDFLYPHAVASIKMGSGVKTEGELIITGTKGYAYVPAPWWKTDYFELRYENPAENKRYFYSLDGEGIRYELVSFVKAIEFGRHNRVIEEVVSKNIVKCMESFNSGNYKIIQ